MPIAIQLDFKGGTLAQYDKMIAKLNSKPGGTGGHDGLFHWVTKTSDGVRITDVWKTKEAFEKFSTEQIGPFAMEAGLPQPAVQFFEVHNYRTGP